MGVWLLVVTHHVLAVGSRLCTYAMCEMVNLVMPDAPTRLLNPPKGTRELQDVHVHSMVIQDNGHHMDTNSNTEKVGLMHVHVDTQNRHPFFLL